jgi:hypothetical protein
MEGNMHITRRTAALLMAVVLVVVAVVVTLTVVVHRSSTTSDTARSATTTVTVQGGGSIQVQGATLRIPPGAVTGNGQLTARTEQASAAITRPAGVTPAQRLSLASQPVSFTLFGARLVRPATLTLTVRPSALPQGSPVAARTDAVWLSYYNTQIQKWQPVPSRYDPSTHTVTAQISHLSLWAPLTWDWTAIGLSLRQAFSALGSGQPSPPNCPAVSGVSVSEAGGQDPPLIGCPIESTPNILTVTITNHRAYAMVLRSPADATAGPPDYKGFEDYVRNLQAVTKALGGSYLAPTASLSYRIPLNGLADVFSAAPSWKTYVLDLAVPVATGLFDTVTLGYANCILNNVTTTEPSLADAPGLVTECIPGLAEATAIGSFYEHDIAPLLNYVQDFLQVYDLAHDAILRVHGGVQITRPNPTLALYLHNGYTLGALYKYPNFPSAFALDNHDYLSGMTWTQISASGASATATLNVDTCNPDCASGTYTTYQVKMVASDPEECSVAVYPQYSDQSQTVQAYVFTNVAILAVNTSPPSAYIGELPLYPLHC